MAKLVDYQVLTTYTIGRMWTPAANGEDTLARIHLRRR